MHVLETRKRPPDEDDEPNTPCPPYLKEPEPDVPDPDDETRYLPQAVQTLASNLGPCA